MKRIASFEVDHTSMKKGIYISRIDGDIVTYDIRTRLPNREKVMDNDAIHTVEHLFATFVRNSPHSDKIIYFGPMGCRTGFYFLTRGLSNEEVISLTKDSMSFIAQYEGEIPGTTEVECGNFAEHSLEGARKEAELFLPVIAFWTEKDMKY